MQKMDTKTYIRYVKYLIILIDLLLLIPLYSIINENIISSYAETPESLAGESKKTIKTLNQRMVDEAIEKYNAKKTKKANIYLEDIFN